MSRLDIAKKKKREWGYDEPHYKSGEGTRDPLTTVHAD